MEFKGDERTANAERLPVNRMKRCMHYNKYAHFSQGVG